MYYLDKDLRPVGLAGAAPHLSGEYVGDPEEVRRARVGTCVREVETKRIQNLRETRLRETRQATTWLGGVVGRT